MTLTITHKPTYTKIDCPCSLANSSKCFGDDDCCYLSANYLKGKDKPNYPVPAIPYDVTFTSYDVIMWRDEQSRECVAAWFFD